MSIVVVNDETFKATVVSLLEVGHTTAPENIDTMYDIASLLMDRMGEAIDVRHIARLAHVRVDAARSSLRSLKITGLFISDEKDKWRFNAGELFAAQRLN